jgi:hypothetical protein
LLEKLRRRHQFVPFFKGRFGTARRPDLGLDQKKGLVVVACICITERLRAQLLLPDIESIEYVYNMHARSKKKVKSKNGRKEI